MFTRELRMPADFGSDAGGGDGNALGKQPMTVNVDGRDYQVEVGQSNKDKEASFSFVGGTPEEANNPQFITQISQELQKNYKRSLQTQQELKQKKAELEKISNPNSELKAELASLRATIEGIKIGLGKNDTEQSQKRDSQSQPFDYEKELLNAAGVSDWDEFDDLTPKQIAKAQAVAQSKQYAYIQKASESQQRQQQESSTLSKLEAKGYTKEEFKVWLAQLGQTNITPQTVDLFLSLKQQNNKPDTTDELDRINEINKIRNIIPSTDINDSIPEFKFEEQHEKDRKKIAADLRKNIGKDYKSVTMDITSLLGKK